ncbi:MAG: hypothetical protein KDB84_11935, partial [Flavobacteriales bacterium]|nr:hypothetical protein [Flavobacteriales bacterium]
GNGTRETDAFHLLACFAAIALLALSYKLPMDLRVRHPRVLMVLTTLIIILFGRNGGEFIYFQF